MPKNANTLVLSYGGAEEETAPAAKPATVEYASVSAAEYDQRLIQANMDPDTGAPTGATQPFVTGTPACIAL